MFRGRPATVFDFVPYPGGPPGDVDTYRRFGNAAAGEPPLVLLQHFRGNLDNWDPLLLDTLAQAREVIPVDNAGVGLSTGTVPRNVTAMARDAIAFTDALGLTRIDLLGYSLGGEVAQELTLLRPQLVRRLVLAATGPQGGQRAGPQSPTPPRRRRSAPPGSPLRRRIRPGSRFPARRAPRRGALAPRR